MKSIKSILLICLVALTLLSGRPYFGDTWTGNSSDQLVTNKAIRNGIDNGVFQLKAGQSVPDDRQVPTKSQVLTWLNIQADNQYLFAKSNSQLVAKRDLVKNYEHASRIYGVPWKGGFDGWATSSQACSGYTNGFTAEIFWDGDLADPAIIYGEFISNLSTSKWYYIDGYAVRISSAPTQNTITGLWSALLTNVTYCGAGPVTGSYVAEKYYCNSCQFITAGVTVNGTTNLTIGNFYTGNDGFVYKITGTTSFVETPLYVSGGWISCASVPCQ